MLIHYLDDSRLPDPLGEDLEFPEGAQRSFALLNGVGF